jgi:mono/diheme cytochrome c family protein
VLFLSIVLVLAAGPAAAQDKAAIERGIKVYAEQKCSVCHAIDGKGNAKGPLDDVGSKYSAAELKLWITSPTDMAKKHNATRKPPMKSYASLPAADVDALVAYLQTVKK